MVYLPTRVIERNFQYNPKNLVEIALEIRSIVAGIAPQAEERLVRGGLSYHDPLRGGPVSAGICGLGIRDDHVRLHFVHGAFLEDPQSLLEGDRLAMRYLCVRSFEGAPWDAIKSLIERSAGFDPRSLS